MINIKIDLFIRALFEAFALFGILYSSRLLFITYKASEDLGPYNGPAAFLAKADFRSERVRWFLQLCVVILATDAFFFRRYPITIPGFIASLFYVLMTIAILYNSVQHTVVRREFQQRYTVNRYGIIVKRKRSKV